jgi:transposase-like protein
MDDVKHPRTLLEAVRYFQDPAICLNFLAALRWPKGVTCPRCGSKEVTFLAKARVWKCRGKHDRQKFSAKVGTVMEDSPIGLDKWLPAMWMLASCKNGISSYELARALRVTQKTAWFMLHRIRLAMQESGGKLGGVGSTVEVDETSIGGAARWMSKSRYAKAVKGAGRFQSGKAIVMAMLERGGRVKARVVKGVSRHDLLPHIIEHVHRGSEIHTDENRAYDGLVSPFEHRVVNHAETYVNDTVHTNSVENFWSLLKRAIRGTYVSVEPFHLFRYLDEQAFRFNTRRAPDGERFLEVVRCVVGKRLMYRDLIGGGSLLALA